MIRTVTAAALMLLTADLALAQTTPAPVAPAPAMAAPAPATAAAPMTGKGGRGGAAQMACKASVDAKPLTGEQRKAEMHTCMTEHRDTCRQQADAAGTPKSGLRDFVRNCMQTGT